MKTYNNNYLKVTSEYNINILNKSISDEDIIINIDSRVVNMYFEDCPSYLIDRLQLTEVKAILIRHSLDNKNSLSTIHFLRVIDLNSSLLNFVIDLKNIEIIIEEENNLIKFIIRTQPSKEI